MYHSGRKPLQTRAPAKQSAGAIRERRAASGDEKTTRPPPPASLFPAGEYQNDLVAVPTPRDAAWPSAADFLSGFADIYDWDVVRLSPGPGPGGPLNALPGPLVLCTRGAPCALKAVGEPSAGSRAAVLQRVGGGGIMCSAADGCASVELEDVALDCADGAAGSAQQAPVRVDGAELLVTRCRFRGCRVGDDGGAIQALRAAVQLSDSTFEACTAAGAGGALSLVGSAAALARCSFVGCAAAGDGGAISVVDYQCTRAQSIPAVTHVEDARFSGCSAEGRGGAVAAVSGSITIRSSMFERCWAGLSGGALFASNDTGRVTLLVLASAFVGNAAAGPGGGAIHSSGADTTLAGMRCENNSAPSGGGGVVLWGAAAPALACGAGAFGPPAGPALDCSVCPPGTFQPSPNATGPSSCAECEAGSFSSGFGATVCRVCPSGTFADRVGSSSDSDCRLCPAGTYGPENGAVRGCDRCPQGQYSSGNGVSACQLCPAGTFATMDGGRTEVEACPGICRPGTYSGPGASVCEVCEAGKFSNTLGAAAAVLGGGNVKITPCEVCQAGRYAEEISSTSCIACGAGTFSSGAGVPCSACAPGTFTNASGATTCSVCPPGAAIDTYGATECIACPKESTAGGPDTVAFSCTSTSNDSLCAMNTRCDSAGCQRGTVGRWISGEAYGNGELITWTIVGPPGSLVLLTFTRLNTEVYDTVDVYSCSNETCTDLTLLGSFAGAGEALPETVNSTTGVMQVIALAIAFVVPFHLSYWEAVGKLG